MINFGNISRSINSAFSQINTVTSNVNTLSANLNRTVNSALGNITAPLTQGFSQLESQVNNLTGSFQQELNQVINYAIPSIDGLGGSVASPMAALQQQVFGASGQFNNTINQALGGLNANLSQFTGQLDTAIGGITQGLDRGISGLTSQLNSSLNSTLGGLTGQLNNSLQGISNNLNANLGALGGAGNDITAQLSQISGLSNTNFNSFLTNGLDSFGGIGPNITNQITNLVNNNPVVQTLNNFDNFVSNAVNVLSSEIQEALSNVTGFLDNPLGVIFGKDGLTGFESFLGSGSSPFAVFGPEGEFGGLDASGSTASNGRLRNVLREHNTYNYIITLGILGVDEFNRPESTYRSSGGFKKIILRSGGGQLDIRQQVAEEGEDHAEYYIEDLFIDSVITPNPNTGVASGTTVSFRVLEPFSMGNFIQAIIAAAAETGYQNYVDAPFCLKIEFTGWDRFGTTSISTLSPPKFIPIKFTKIDFNVSASGSVYQVEAVPMTESGLEDTIANIRTTINANGSFVHEMLLTSSNSVTQAYNAHIEHLEETDVIGPHDRILITFPKTNRSVLEALERGLGTEDDVTAPEQLGIDRAAAQESDRRSPELQPEDPDTERTYPSETVEPKGEIFRRLEAWATEISNMNEIGTSLIVDDPNAAGDQAQTDMADGQNDQTDVIDRSTVENSVSETSRTVQSQQNENILRIIDRVVLASQWAREKVTEETGPTGVRDWFKVETKVYLETNPPAEVRNGRPPRYYVYEVLPYFPDEAKFLANNQRPQGTEALMAAAVKEYNYIYTGQNEDIIDFDINFNNAFMQTAFADFGNRSGGIASSLSDSVRQHFNPQGAGRTDRGAGGTGETGGSNTLAPNFNSEGPNIRTNDIRVQIAHMFHQRLLYQTVDMVTAEMKIWGDPYYIPQLTGNWAPPPSGNPMIGQDGSMNYGTHEVMIVVLFQNPIDMQKNGPYYDFPQIVRGFSGLFSVRAVENHFNDGKFTQVLKLIRRFGQDDPATPQNTPFVSFNQTANDINQRLTGNSSLDTAIARGALTGNPNVGFNPGQVDPALAAAAAIQRANQLNQQAAAEAAVGLDPFGGSGSVVPGVNTPPIFNPDQTGPQ